MDKKHYGNVSLSKLVILLLAVIGVLMLSSCSYIENISQEKEAIKLIDTDEQKPSPTPSPAPSVTNAPSPGVIPEKNRPIASEEIIEPTTEPLDPPTVTKVPDASDKTDEVTEPSPTSAPEPTRKPGSQTPPNVTDVPGISGEVTTKPVVTPKPTAIPTLPSKDGFTSLEAYADEILKQIITKGMSEVEKVKAVHDFIILNTAYYDNNRLKPEDYPADVFTTRGVLLNGEAVCQGYAETFQLFMDRLGINCKFVVGKDRVNLVGHAWNMVSLGGKWYHVDVTWDDPLPDQKGKIQYKYFLITDEMLSVDHSWNTKNYPACNSSDYLYYVYEDYIIDSIENYEQKFVALYEQGERTITILYPEEGRPDLSFFFDYDFLHTIDAEGTKHMGYKHYPIWKLGEYTVYTVIVD